MLSLFPRAAGNRFYVARITGVEVTSALTRKQRARLLSADAASRALKRLERDLAKRQLYIIEVTPAVLEHARQLAARHGLRGYDAVQLASVLEANRERAGVGLPPLVLVTADSELLAVGAAEGLNLEDPNNH